MSDFVARPLAPPPRPLGNGRLDPDRPRRRDADAALALWPLHLFLRRHAGSAPSCSSSSASFRSVRPGYRSERTRWLRSRSVTCARNSATSPRCKSSTFTVEDGEFFMLLGPSGCGKTTTLRMIAGLELPTSGEIFIDGEDVARTPRQPARHRLRVPDVRALPAHERAQEHRLSAGQPGRAAGRGARQGRGGRPHPRHRAHARPARRRPRPAATASASRSAGPSCGSPKAFLMDEPLGALDAEFREHMAEELRALHDRMGATTVYVTHDQLEAMQMGDKIVVMNHGVIEQFGTPQDIYDRPATHVRRRLHRLAVDELPALRRHGRPRRRLASRLRRRRDRRAGAARAGARGGWCSASGPSTSPRRRRAPTAARCWRRNISAPPRSSRSTPPMAAIKARVAVGPAGARRRDRRPRLRRPHRHAVRPASRPRAAVRRQSRGCWPMAEVVLRRSAKRFGTQAALDGRHADRRPTASSSCCSAPPAPARRRRCG